jgi:hypothetical protein
MADRPQRAPREEDVRRLRILDTICRALERNELAPQAEDDGFYFHFRGRESFLFAETRYTAITGGARRQ